MSKNALMSDYFLTKRKMQILARKYQNKTHIDQSYVQEESYKGKCG